MSKIDDLFSAVQNYLDDSGKKNPFDILSGRIPFESRDQADRRQRGDQSYLNKNRMPVDVFVGFAQTGDVRYGGPHRSFCTEEALRLAVSLHAACAAWCELDGWDAAYESAQNVLRCYYGETNLAFFLEQLYDFAEKIPQIEDVSFIEKYGYGIVLSAERQMLKMRQAYAAFKAETVEPPRVDVPLLFRFIRLECKDSGVLAFLPDAYDQVRRAQESVNASGFFFLQDVEVLNQARQCLSERGYEESVRADIDLLRRMVQRYRERGDAVRAHIERMERLYGALDALLTEDWFAGLKPAEADDPRPDEEKKAFLAERYAAAANDLKKIIRAAEQK